MTRARRSGIIDKRSKMRKWQINSLRMLKNVKKDNINNINNVDKNDKIDINLLTFYFGDLYGFENLRKLGFDTELIYDTCKMMAEDFYESPYNKIEDGLSHSIVEFCKNVDLEKYLP